MIEYDNKNWFRLVFAFRGTVVPKLAIEIVLLMAWTAVVLAGYKSAVIPKDFKIDMVVFNVIGLALGLLLVFRTNSSYDRYWEGRKLMGAVTNASRNIAIILNSLISENEQHQRRQYISLLSAFIFALKARLRTGVGIKDLPMLENELRNSVLKQKNVPLAILNAFYAELSTLKTQLLNAKDAEQLTLNTEFANLVNSLGGMERIRYTPMPFPYASHLRMFITLYFVFLPFGLSQQLGWITVPAIGIISLVLIGINEIGIEIEDPFGTDPNDLPMDAFCNNVTSNVEEILLRK
jgi:putative membrane protein